MEKNVSFDEYTKLYNLTTELHGETKQELNTINNRLDKIDDNIQSLNEDMQEIKVMLKMLTRELFKKDVI